ncbi:RloB family protein [Actinacidiphila oryziradicis]|uniref:RloB domain-containing protein n=1 Tax=Actinacidiphila oryziradicis TaxID=2571141 RepID=A0A4U0SMU9_9ACTN|nr:RloB family protein [Actinacidiphila oryziradicis]TKA11284.1 RloB domain-containing protein [Actinacidiphila oryziradicis]
MAKPKGRDSAARRKSTKRGRENRPRDVYIFTEGEVTEPEYIDIILREGDLIRPDQRVERHFENATATGKYRKPLPMVKEAISVLRRVEREARDAGLEAEDWNWPQVWVLFDRDDHQGIPEARKLAEQADVKIAYSHPCFELWRLLHYQNYTSTFGGVCGSANSRLHQQPGFAQTYGKNVRAVSEQQSKHIKPDQILRRDRYSTAKKYAQKINNGHDEPDPTTWDPYTDVWRFVEDGLLLSGY